MPTKYIIPNQDRLLSSQQLMDILGIGKTSLWKYIKQGKLPHPMLLSPRCARWRWGEVCEYLGYGELEIHDFRKVDKRELEELDLTHGDFPHQKKAPVDPDKVNPFWWQK